MRKHTYRHLATHHRLPRGNHRALELGQTGRTERPRGTQMTLSVLDIIEGTSVDGPGLRTSIYMAGCTHHCVGCHNPQSWNIDNGTPYSIDALMEVISYNNFPVTLTGGDPFFQVDAAAELAEANETSNFIFEISLPVLL